MAAAAIVAVLTCQPQREEEVTWPEVAPESCCEVLNVGSRTVAFAWAHTLGKWGIGDLAFGIKRHMKRQGNLQHEYIESSSVQLKGDEVFTELVQLLEYLNLCNFFSKRPFPVFLKSGRYTEEDVLIKKTKARFMKPKFALICDKHSKCFILLIRGAISTKERLTAASAAEVPFHRIVLHEGRINNVVTGHAHYGMVVAARWIAKLAIPSLYDAVHQFPDYKIKIIGHSMGAGIASILACILRERQEFSSCTCVAFAPAACMTWELAESGKDFITSLVNKSDVVPAFSKVSSENLRSEVVLSRSDDVKDNVNCISFFNVVSHIPLLSSKKSNARNPDMIQSLDSTVSEPLLKHDRGVIPASTNGNASNSNGQDAGLATNRGQEIIVSGSSIMLRSAVESDAAHAGTLEEDEDVALISRTKEEESRIQNEHREYQQHRSQHTLEPLQFFPPGRIVHMVALPSPDSNHGDDTTGHEVLGVYQTSRHLYGRMRLAPKMIKEHYMPSYIETLELLIDRYGKEDSGCTSSIIL